ncbi:MAG: N-acetylmuramoyl-L-alanine amidase family protein [Candidatus Dormibacteria bacterium]
MRKGPTRSLYVLALALGITALGGGLVTGTVLASVRAPALVAQHLRAPHQYVVAIMPGHGGYDPGAISPFNGLKEKNVTLSMGLDLRKDLEAEGVKVVMTRTTDTDVTISKAEQIARDSHAQALLSLWVNDWTTDSLEGATVFMPHSTDMPLAKKLSASLATAIAPAGMGDRGTQLLPQLWVHAPMPAVTIEVGFMSNQQDSVLLAEPSFRALVASGLAKGMLAYAPQIPRIDTQLIAYRRAEAKLMVARRAATQRQATLRQMASWAPTLLLLDGLLMVVLYKDLLWRGLRGRAPGVAGLLLTVAAALAAAGGSGLDAVWRVVTRARPRPVPGRGTKRPGRSRPTRPRRPPREWRGRAAGTHPRRVTEMVQPGDRRRQSIYDDFSF